MELLHKLKEERDLEIKEAQSNQSTDTSIFLSNSIINIYSESEDDDYISPKDMEQLLYFRELDISNLLYYNEIAEIFIQYSNIEYSLKLNYATESTPPTYLLENTDDTIIMVPYSKIIYLTENINLYFKYGNYIEEFDCGNKLIIKPGSSSNNVKFINEKNPKITFIYDTYKEGLICPIIEYQFNLEFWNKFKQYQYYLYGR